VTAAYQELSPPETKYEGRVYVTAAYQELSPPETKYEGRVCV
jgi:hypothetical protein